MDFKKFYDNIVFDVDKTILQAYNGKQGDTKSRGLYVTVTQKNAVIEDLTGLSMRFFYEKPDKTRGFIDGVVDGNKFRIDYTNQMYAVPGVVKAELRLMGADGEIITAKTFKILVDSSIADGSIVSENERGILDRAFELAEDIIPRLELLDVELLEDVQAEMLGARHSGTKDATYDSLGQRLDAAEQDLLDHKAEYTSNRQQDQLKVAKVEKELNDYKATMQQVNINQEPKQKATGYGIVSLPPNAANGQVSVTLKGLTATNLIKNGNFANGTTNWGVGGGTISVSNNTAIVTSNGNGTANILFQDTGVDYKNGKTLFLRCKARVTNSVSNGLAFRISDTNYSNVKTIGTTSTPIQNSWYVFYAKVPLTADSSKVRVQIYHQYPDAATANGKVMEVQEMLAIDLDTHPTLAGLTADQINQAIPTWFDGTKSTIGAVRLVSEGANKFNGEFAGGFINSSGELNLRSPERTTKPIRCTPNQQYVISGGNRNVWRFLDTNGNYIPNSYVNNATATAPSNADKMQVYYSSDGTHREIMINEGSTVLPYEPYTESISYINAGDDLRSLPNGTNDEINVTDRKLIKRIGEKSNITNGMEIDFADMAVGGTYYAWNEDGETEAGVKGDTLGIDATTLTYQLAEPIEIPIQVSGSIVSYPNGTIYIERILPDAGVYTDKITILHQDAPIKRLDKLSKVDFMTGVETELDVSEAVIAEDKLSFTHPDLSEGDIVFFEYEYDVESTEGETEIEYYDSRYTIKDSVTDKFYKWNVAVADGVPSIELVEV